MVNRQWSKIDCLVPKESSWLIRTRDGIEIDAQSDHWRYRSGVHHFSCNFSLVPRCTKEFLLGIKTIFAWYLENLASTTVKNTFARLLNFLRHVARERNEMIDEITHLDLLNYRAHLGYDRSWWLGYLAGLFKRWNAMGIHGVSPDAARVLERMTIPGNAKGVAVLTADPVYGPYTDIELAAIQEALISSYTDGKTPLADFVLVWLFMLLGQRPIQYAALKVCDLSVDTAKDGSRMYLLQVPRAKQRGINIRGSFSTRVLVPSIGALLVTHADQIRGQFKNEVDTDQLPLFPATKEGKTIQGFKFHRTNISIAKLLERALSNLNVSSERTGKRLDISATRFRRTLGTRAAVEGHGEVVIAELLDHSDTQSASVYVEATPTFIDRIDRAMAMSMAPLAHAFSGTLLREEREMSAADTTVNRIFDGSIAPTPSGPMGTCGTTAACARLAPIACYTCSCFRPWIEGPHEAVLDHLLVERERLMKETDARIASINDRSILAVGEVILMCRDHKGLQKEG